MKIRYLVVIASFFLMTSAIAGCGESPGTLRVGSKGFAEQQVLAQMLAELARADGWSDVSVVDCNDTYDCHRALRTGAIDLMVEYSGTGLTYLGHRPLRGKASLTQARKLFAPLGIRWLGTLGFDNNYRLLIPAQRAAARGIVTIADLAQVNSGQGLRVACPAEYLRRPLDGLASLARRHGLRLAGKPLVIEAPQKRFAALFDGRADVAVGYATDGAIDRLGLRALDDTLGFFPSYQAAVVLRAELAGQRKKLVKALVRLEGKLTESVMRRLNYSVQVEGQKPAVVARRFLRRQRLLGGEATHGQRSAQLVIVLDRDDTLRHEATRAVGATRRVFSAQTVTTQAVDAPAAALSSGKARLALVGAERFFHPGKLPPPKREARMEAVAVVGTRVLHLLRRAGDNKKSNLSGKLGTQPRNSGGGIVAKELLEILDRAATRHGTLDTLLAGLTNGTLDGALVLARAGHPTIAQALSQGRASLVPLSVERDAALIRSAETSLSLRLPYLRPARIPAGTYRSQPAALDTLGTQVVLAGPTASSSATAGGGGPAAALPGGGHPLTRTQVLALARATGVAEAPDPALPSAWKLHGAATSGPREETAALSLMGTLLNLFSVAFLVWLAFLLFRRQPATRDAE